MAVPLLDVVAQNRALESELQDAFRRVLRSGHYILGQEVQLFEKEMATRCGVAHGIGTSSGTDAHLLAHLSLGIGPGEEVLCPSFTFFATAGSIARAGATRDRPNVVCRVPVDRDHAREVAVLRWSLDHMF